ncbi:putative neuropeptide receptor [Nephila pilipes]|uniref:Putative neuropeptide receptor n=1 Tax=Nephila pilipes TaxID=299642 RepID=A0A8X6NYU1_NEPPI|nr:putative neuropeptide receptor [Nephila pilipes]
MNNLSIEFHEETFEDTLNKSYSEKNFSQFDFFKEGPIDYLWQEMCLKTFIYTVIFLTGLIGNLCVIMTVIIDRSMRTTMNFYFVNLASADLVLSVCFLWVPLSNSITRPMREFICKLDPFTQTTCLTATTLTLTAIACERFIAIIFPLHTRITKHRNWVVISSIWVVSVIVSTPFLIVKKFSTYQERNFPEISCEDDWDSLFKTYPLKQLYYTFMTMTLFFLPAIIMIVLYLIVVCRLTELQVPGETNINVHQQNKKKVRNL